jgi:serine/threonine-protein kinase
MEFLDGTNPEELIDANGPLPVERALLITAQITRALEAAHAADVIHRDLKPANVMLVNRKGEDDFVKVLDFGISKDLDLAQSQHGAALTRPDVAIGTPVYMAPEQAAGRPANALTDVYAAGGLLYEMLTGCPPCAGTDAIDVLHKKANEDPVAIATLRPDLPKEVERLVTRALSRAPRDRQPSMNALKEDVLACLGIIERTSTGPMPVPHPARATQMRSSSTEPVRIARKRGTILTVVGAAAFVAAVVVLSIRQATPNEPAPAAIGSAEPAASTATDPPPRADRGAAVRPTPTTAAVDSESTPWPERETPAAPNKRATLRPNTALPAQVSIRREQLGPRVNAALGGAAMDGRAGAPLGSGAARAPAARHTSVAALAAETDAAHKVPAALPERPGSGANSTPAAAAEEILGRGQSAFDRGDYPEALRRGREAIAAGGVLRGHLLVGDAYYRLERFPDALREYQAALALDPVNASIKRRRDLAEKSAPQ